uniref:BTB domain-containing protein n=1 Tax=Strigamia maritima TaxID=126957 RepID=T1JKK2_STRMM
MAALTEEPDYSVFENKSGLGDDMKFLASMPELCDITFLVGESREPVCAVKAILAARSREIKIILKCKNICRVFHKMFFGNPQQPTAFINIKKKDSGSKETGKLKMFLKRTSEPMLILTGQTFNQNAHVTLVIDEFEPDVFRQLIEYIHTGCVTLQARTLLGVMNAADYYSLDELRKACLGFVQCCINVDTVCALLASAEKYIQYKCTKSLVQKALEFVDIHGNEVLSLGSFTLLPQHVVRLILSRDELKAEELTKFHASLMWSKKFCDTQSGLSLCEVMANFLEFISFHKIPASQLMKEVHPLLVVPDQIIMNALAYQADPTSVDINKLESPNRLRGPPSQQRSLSTQGSHDIAHSSNTTLSSISSDLPQIVHRKSTDSGGTSPSGGASLAPPSRRSTGPTLEVTPFIK